MFHNFVWTTIRTLTLLNIIQTSTKERFWLWNKKAFRDQLQFVVGMASNSLICLASTLFMEWPHSLAFCGSTCCCMWGVLGNTISCTNLMTFSSLFFSSVSCLVKTLLHFEAVMKPALCKYHSSHCHCFAVVVSTWFLSASLKDNKLTTSSVEIYGMIAHDLSQFCIHNTSLSLVVTWFGRFLVEICVYFRITIKFFEQGQDNRCVSF